jgi:hypothetical protein
LLAKSVQAPPSGRGQDAHGDTEAAELAIERKAPPEEPAWPSHPALRDEQIDAQSGEPHDQSRRREGERRGPILRDTRAREGAARRRESFASEGEVQVGRGPLALHLSRAATEERLAESEERLVQSDKRLLEVRRELEDREARLAVSAERLTQTAERLAQAEKRLAALEERLMMTEESERHAAEQQARAEESREALAAQISAMELREAEWREEHESERAARARVEAELERLRGSFATLAPLVHALHEATGEIQAVLAHEPEAGVAHSGGQSGDAGGGGGIAQTPSADAPSYEVPVEGTGTEYASSAGDQVRSEEAAPNADAVDGDAASAVGGGEGQGEAGLLGALVEVVERWRAHTAGS